MSKKIINFYPSKDEYSKFFDHPVLAKNIIPEWYKRQNRYGNGFKEMNPKTGNFNSTIKACMPVFDIMTAGYIFTTPADIYVTINQDGSPDFSWSINDYICIESHGPMQYDEYKIPNEYYPLGYKFINPWVIQTPKGYSSFFISPTFRDDLPFECLPAIVDTDKHPIAVNFPFFIRNGFEGTIPMGTPIMQVIPFKRDEWNHRVNEYSKDLWITWKKAERKIQNRYKTFFRTLKEWS
jgi:hypothetical protein